ncbi:hypothetical protein TIFTF001_044511 [Ficus carica]|uniref:Uncharacterized protein n=1 Tax=Ficus carica TaxID=3494 RepID=A0AA88CT83_FICCA|nr:hypothetical protein TIFTF001_044511 [Ficus carica]
MGELRRSWNGSAPVSNEPMGGGFSEQQWDYLSHEFETIFWSMDN